MTDSVTFQECKEAVELGMNTAIFIGVVCGFLGSFAFAQVWSFARPFVMYWMDEQRTKRGLECHCDECEERSRSGIDN